MYIYAQLDAQQVCFAISMLVDEVTAPNMVRISEYNEDYMWRKYENGGWSTEKFPPPEPEYQKPVSEEIAELKAENEVLRQRVAQNQDDVLFILENMFN